MASFKGLMKDTVLYGLSTIVGRFINYLLVPLYTHYMPKETGDYGVSVNIYAYTAIAMVLLTFGMESTLFYFANEKKEKPDTVFTTAIAFVTLLSAIFLGTIFLNVDAVCESLGYSSHPEYVLIMATCVAVDAILAIPFSYLRFQKRPLKFSSLKMLNILMSIALNVIFFVLLGHTEVFYVFAINLFCSVALVFGFVTDFFRIQWHFSWGLFRQMLRYSAPLVILGIAGVLNQTADKILYPLIDDSETGKAMLGEYGACVKIAMIMAMLTQAFRYAYEPIVFAIGKDKDSKVYYAAATKYFIMFTLLAFLGVVATLDVLQLILGKDYRDGMRVVPIVMAAEIMMGVYFNLSFWYKLTKQTWWGAIFSTTGCVALIAINFLYIPQYGYEACAWGGFVAYAICMVLNYAVGQWKNPFPYDMKRIGFYTALATALYFVMDYIPLEGLPGVAVKLLLVLVYVAAVVKLDVPQSVVERYKSAIGRFVKRR